MFQNHHIFVQNLEDIADVDQKKFTEKAKNDAKNLLKFLKNKHALRYIAISQSYRYIILFL